MKRLRIVLLFPVVFLLCACEVQELTSLKEISRPYEGVYECETLTIGGREAKDHFELIRLELKRDGTFRLFYQTAEGAEGGYDGTYEANEEGVTFTGRSGAFRPTFTFPFEEGKIVITYLLGDELLYCVFAP